MSTYAKAALDGEVLVGSVADAITEINAYAAGHEGEFTVAIVDHGEPDPEQHVGGGGAGKQLDDTQGGAALLASFTSACSGEVSRLNLYGCNVAQTTAGKTFVQGLADAGDMDVKACEARTFITKYWFLGWFYRWSTGPIVTKTPAP